MISNKYCTKCGAKFHYCSECGAEIHICRKNTFIQLDSCNKIKIIDKNENCFNCGNLLQKPKYCTQCGFRINRTHNCSSSDQDDFHICL